MQRVQVLSHEVSHEYLATIRISYTRLTVITYTQLLLSQCKTRAPRDRQGYGRRITSRPLLIELVESVADGRAV